MTSVNLLDAEEMKMLVLGLLIVSVREKGEITDDFQIISFENRFNGGIIFCEVRNS